MKRRTFLKLSAAGVGALALGQLGWTLGQSADVRDLILVSNAGDDSTPPSVGVIDAASFELLATLPLPSSYSFPATRWDPGRDLIWSGLPAGPNNAINAYRLSSGEQLLELPTGSSQNYTELTPDGRYLIAAARFVDRFVKIGADPEQGDFGQVVAEFATYQGASPCDITLTSDGRYAYAPDRGGDTVSAIRVEPFERASVTPLETFDEAPLEPFMATVSPRGDVLFVENAVVQGGSQTGSESIFDLSDPEQPVEIARLGPTEGLGLGPITSEFTPDGRFGIVICRDSSELSIIDPQAAAVVASVQLPEGSNPLTGTFVLDGPGDAFFVPLPGRDAVAVVAVPSFEVVKLIPVGVRPTGVVHLRAALPERDEAQVPLGVALATGRTFAADCPDRCCGAI